MPHKRAGCLLLALNFLYLGGCGERHHQEEAAVTTMTLTSELFADGQEMPRQLTADGDDRSPPLAWTGTPEGTQSLALICDDPDAPSPRSPAPDPWVHWLLFNMTPEVSEIPAGLARAEQAGPPPGALQGSNSWPRDNLGYRGPAPPPGSGRHRYVFQIYALDTKLNLSAGATKPQLVAAMAGHILGTGKLVGTYER